MKRMISLCLMLSGLVCAASAANVYKIYPVPHSQTACSGTAGFTATVTVVAGPSIDQVTLDRAFGVLEAAGLKAVKADKAGNRTSAVYLGVNGEGDRADRLATKMKLSREVFGKDKFDRHILSLTAAGSGAAQVLILGENTDAVFCGLASLEQILDNGTASLPCVTIEDYADVRNRGIIEGYYGVPYSAEVTKDLFHFMARYKLNTYMYGAKSDPYHSRFWGEPYPETITGDQKRIGYFSRDMLKDINATASACKVNFIWAIHPGKSFIDMDDPQVNERIMEKFESMYDLGVRQFGVFVDDVGVPSDINVLKFCSDRLSDLQNRIDKRWNVAGAAPADTVKPLHYVPQLYAYSWVSREKAAVFFSSLTPVPDKVNIYITGREVWTVPNNEDLSAVKEMLGRPVSWWWNYPCNDQDVTKIYPMDIYTNFRDETNIDNLSRIECLDGARTLIINPMQQGEISKIPLFSVADYTWNNDSFDSQRSWEAAIPAVVGEKMAEAMFTLAPYLRYYDNDALEFAVSKYKASVAKGNPKPAALISKLRNVTAACEVLKGLKDGDGSDRLLYEDLRPWLLKLEAMSLEAANLLEGLPSTGVDFDNNPDFQYEILKGMGKGIKLSVRTAEPSAAVLMPFVKWLRDSSRSEE